MNFHATTCWASQCPIYPKSGHSTPISPMSALRQKRSFKHEGSYGPRPAGFSDQLARPDPQGSSNL